MTTDCWSFDWNGVRGELWPLGGMLGPVWFTLPDGREVQPFAVAPWSDDPAERLADQPPILHRLRGEFPCVPFGVPEPPRNLPGHWTEGVDPDAAPVDPNVHGYSSNHDWHLVEQDETGITIAIDYPADHPVRRLERRITLRTPGVLGFDLVVEMRRDATLPMGLHPIFALPEQPGSARLSIPSLGKARTFPVAVEENSIFEPDQTLDSLTAIRLLDGTTMDMTALPLDAATEELVAVHPGDGAVELALPQAGYAVDLRWDITSFPQCLLWLSNRGRQAYPWSGPVPRHRD